MRGTLTAKLEQWVARVERWAAWSGTSPRVGLARKAALTVTLGLATAYFLRVVNGHYPIRHWLFLLYAGYWALTLWFNVSCLVAGYALLRVLVPTGLPARERVLFSMAVGVLAFYVGTFLAGLAHLYGVAFFVGWPLVMFLGGGLVVVRRRRTLSRILQGLRAAPPRRRSLLRSAILAFGVLSLGVVYLSVLTPDNVAYDGRWYHLPIAEHYAALHGVEAFPEGWYQGALPHLASFLYTWAMLWPLVHVVDRVLLCSHIEFSLFLWTLYGVAVLVRRVAPGKPAPLAWVAVFLFPSIFVYDSNLNTTADHIAAFWAAPIFLALLRVWKDLDLRMSVLLGAMLAGAIGTKYQSSSLVVFPAIALGVRLVWLTLRPRSSSRAQPALSVLATTAAMIALWSPHWLKNLVWYRDPLYPLLHGVVHSTPWTPDGDLRFALMSKTHLWRPVGTLAERTLETLRALWSFSFEPHDWHRLKEIPVFGSLFTLLVLALPFLRARARLWSLFLAANVGVFWWYWLSHQDRYLQSLLPWFAASTAAAISLAWGSGLLPRIALCGLVGAQVVWGSDAPFIHAHRMLSESQIKVALDRITSGFDQAPERRTLAFADMSAIGKALPEGAKVLLHETEPHLGLQRASVSDAPAWQGGISYGRFRSPAELDDRLRGWGVTHIAMLTGKSADVDSLPGDIVFFDYVTGDASPVKTLGAWTVYQLPAERPSAHAYGDILWLGCGNFYAKGRYAMTDMMLPFSSDVARFPSPRRAVTGTDATELDEAAVGAGAVGLDPTCQALVPRQLAIDFTHVVDRGSLQVWIRRRETKSSP